MKNALLMEPHVASFHKRRMPTFVMIVTARNVTLENHYAKRRLAQKVVKEVNKKELRHWMNRYHDKWIECHNKRLSGKGGSK